MKLPGQQLIKVILAALACGGIGFFASFFILEPFFSGSAEMPQSFRIGNLRLQLYGIILAIAALAGYWLAKQRSKKYEVAGEDIDNILLATLVSGFIGARVYHVLSELPYYLQNLSQALMVWRGGLSIYGAALGGALGLWVYLRRTRTYSLAQLLDWLAPSLALGQIIGRFGNFVNYELYGLPTQLPWKMAVPEQFRQPPYILDSFFHPLFLYEAAGSVVIFVLLLRLNLKGGRLFLLWLLLYNVMRFFLEFLRINSVIYGGIRLNAVVSLALIGIAVLAWYRINHVTTTSSSN